MPLRWSARPTPARAALSRLPEHERAVIEMAYFQQLSLTEIAERLEAPVGTVKSRASRGTRRLALLMGREADHPVRSHP